MRCNNDGMSGPAPVPIVVTSCEDLAPRARRFVFDGMSLVGSTLPGAYLSLWFRDPSEVRRAHGSGRTAKRTFTVRSLDPARGSMTVDFVLHGSGPAATWAATARQGDRIWAGETKGGYEVPPDGSYLVMIGDDTAMPAIGAIAEAAGDAIGITTVVEVVDELDERPISDERALEPIWIHRGEDVRQTGLMTLRLLEELSVPDDAHWWIAGEREAVRTMRDTIVEGRGTPRDRISLNAHWRLRPTDPRSR